MTSLQLDSEERDVLIDALESYLSDLRMEIADTDSHDFRQMLKSRRRALERIHAALVAGRDGGASGRVAPGEAPHQVSEETLP